MIEEEEGDWLEESARPLPLLLVLRLRLKFVTLMIVMRLIIKSIASVTPIAKPVVVPGMVPVLVVVSAPILEVLSSSILVIVIPLSVNVVVVVAAVVSAIHLMHLEWVLLLLLLLPLLLMIEVRFDLLRPTPIHFGIAIVFVLPLPVLPPFVRQLTVHVGLLSVPATDWRSVPAMGELLEMINNVVSVSISVAISIVVSVTVVAVKTVILSVIGLIAGRQRATASAVAVHVTVVGRGGIAGCGR